MSAPAGPRARSRDPLLWGATAVLVGATSVALAGPWLPLGDPTATDLTHRLQPPGAGHWLGTDHLGRDVLARLVSGMRASLAVSVFGTFVAAGLGTLLGLVAGYRGGRLDTVTMRGVDVLLAFPYVLLALAIVAALGPGLRNAALAVAIVNIPFFARTVRGATLALRDREFVEVARLSGHGDGRIALREVLPNILPLLLAAVATTLGWMLLETAGLSFLGLGAQPPRADLGSMLGQGRRFLTTAPHLSLAPGAAIFVLSLAVHGLADAVRDRLDPRLAPGESSESSHAPEPVVNASETARAPAGDDRATLLEVRDLVVEIDGPGRVVDGVDLRVERGEAVALVGESGSGKSLSVSAFLGLAPTGARVTASKRRLGESNLDGLDAEGWRAIRGGRIGYVPQDPGASLNPLLTIGAQVVEALRAHRPIDRAEARQRAIALLARVRLRDPERLLDAWPHQLSGGMRQRVLIAIAIANDPELIVADEPTTALDVTVQAGILALLEEARVERRRGLILVTHDLAVAARLCSRVYVMHAGRIVESGDLGEILERPRADYTRTLLACIPRLDDPGAVLRAASAADGRRA